MIESFIYLGSPYSDKDPAVMERRWDAICRVANHYMRVCNEVVYSPIAHNHPVAVRGGLPRGWDYWEKNDRIFLSLAKRLDAVMLDGWDESKGLNAEIQIATELGKEIRYIDPSDMLEREYDNVG